MADSTLDKDLADFAIKYAQKRGATYCEARLESTQGSGFILKNGIAQVSGFDRWEGIGIRILYHNRLGFGSTNILLKTNVKKLVQSIIRNLNTRVEFHQPVSLSAEQPSSHEYAVKEKKTAGDVSPHEKLGILKDADQMMLDTNIKTLGRYIALSDSLREEYLVTSEGTKILSRLPHVGFSYHITVRSNYRTMQRYWAYGSTGGFEYIDSWNIPEIMVDEVKSCDFMLSNGKSPPKKAVDVIAAPQVVGIMVHESVGHPHEADRILGREAAQAGESFVTTDMLGTKIGSDAVNVVDNPTVPNSNGFYLYDNEGVKAREKQLIKKGIISELLHNRETAAVMKTRSNASARAASYERESIVRMSNTYMKQGNWSEEELIEDTKNGVYLKNFMEWNIDDKRFNQRYVGAEAYMIRNGRITGPILNPIIEITTPALYSSVDAVANNLELHAGSCGKGEPLQGIPVSFGGPSIRIRKILLGR